MPHAIDAEVRLYDHLFSSEMPEEVPEGGRYLENLNPKSLETLTGCKLEPSVTEFSVRRDAFGTLVPDRVQFERHAYFCVDPDSAPGKPVFNRTVSLKDTWAKMAKKG